MKKITYVGLFILLALSVTGCENIIGVDDGGLYTVQGIVRGVVGGQVSIGEFSGTINSNGMYSVENIEEGDYELKIFDNNNTLLKSDNISVTDDMVKNVTVDNIRLTYWRPQTDINKSKDMIDKLADNGVTDLYVETFFHGMTIYPSQYASQKGYADDYFNQLIDYAHSKGIRVHAWVEALYWYNLKWIGDPPAGHILDGDDEVVIDGNTYTINKSLVTTDKEGNIMIENGKVFASPFNDEVVNLVKNIVDEIDSTYDVDGISLDYIRFPKADPAFGYGPGSPYEDGMTEEELHELRVEAVKNLVAEVGNVIDKNTLLSAAVFPGYYTDTGSEYNKSQDWKGWIGDTGIDWLQPMCYDYSIDNVNADLQLSFDAQKSPVTIIPVLAINSGHEDIQTQYNDAYTNYNFAGYGVWKADYIDSVLP